MMTSFLYFLPIIFLVIVIIFRFFWESRDILPVIKSGRRRISLKNIALISIILPYITSCIILYSGNKKPVLHFKLEGIKFSLQQKKGKPRLITIGGSRENDIFVKDLPKDAFFIKKSEEGLFIHRGDGYEGYAIIKSSNTIPGLVALRDQSKIKISRKTKKGKTTSNFEISQGGIGGLSVKIIHGGSVYKIPLRKYKIPFVNIWMPILSLPKAYNRVFPLGKLKSGKDWQNGIGYKSSIMFGDFKARNKNRNSSGPFLIALDHGVSINVDGEKIEPFPIKIEPGKPLSFLRLYGKTRPRLKTLIKIREVKILNDTVEFFLERPDTIAAKLEAQSKRDRFVIGSIENLNEKIIHFRNLSGTFSKYFAVLELEKEEITVSGPFITKKFSYNQDIEIGNEDKFVIRILRKGIPWYLIGLLIFIGIMVFFATRLLGKLKYIILFGSISILTTSRVLFAYTATTLPPFSIDAIPLSVFLLVFAPSLVIAVDSLVKILEFKDSDFLKKRKRYIINGIAALLLTLAVGIPQMVYLSSMLLLGSLIPVLILAIVLIALFKGYSAKHKRIEKYRRRSEDFLFKSSNRPLNIILIAFVVGRLILLIFGNKESVNIGARFSISIITVPVLIIFIGLCTARFVEKALTSPSKKVIYHYIGYTFGFSAIFFIFAFVTNDLGQLIFSLPISMFLTAVMLWSYKKISPGVRKHSFILALPLALILLFLMFPVATLQVIEGITEKESVGNDIFESDIVSRGQNVLRLMQYVAPKHLEEIGSISSESVAQHYAIMNAYTRRGFGGEGYMNIKVHPSLYRTCLNDNVSAVYIFSQFGVLGAITIIFAYGIMVFIGYRSRQEIMHQQNQLWRLASSISLLSVLVIIVVSLYMLGANCNLLLFTGRNLYFMGLNSMSDIFESSVLLGFITAGIAIGEISQKRR